MAKTGFILIEKIAVIFVGSLLVLGASDLFKILHVQLALKNAVDVSLRCLYPLKGECRQQASNQSVKYNVYESVIDKIYSYPVKKISVYENRTENPVYEYSQPVANILDSVEYSEFGYPLYQKVAQNSYYASAKYLVQVSEFPYIDTTYGAFKPLFKYKVTRSPYPILKTSLGQSPYGISGITGRTKTSLNLGMINFTVPNLESLNCYKSTQVDSPSVITTDFSQACSTSNVNLVISISGKYSLRNSSRARIELELTQGTRKIDLGGRAYNLTPGGEASLVPRGAFENYISSNYGYQEFSIHSPISVQRNIPIKLSFKLTKLSGASNEYVDWIGEELKLYGQEYRVAENALDCNSSQICFNSIGIQVPSSAINSYRKATTYQNQLIGCSAKSEINTLNSDYVLAEWEPFCSKIKRSVKCQDNFGITGNPSNSELVSACRIQNVIIDNYNLRSKFLNYSTIFERKTCDENLDYKKIPELSPYSNIRFLEKKLTGFKSSTNNQLCSDGRVVKNSLGDIITDSNSICDYSLLAQQKYPSSSPIELKVLTVEEVTSKIKPVCASELKTMSNNFWVKRNLSPLSLEDAQRLCPGCKYESIVENMSNSASSFRLAEYNYGYSYLKAAIPGLNWNCDGINCANVRANYNLGKYQVSAKVRIPLFFKKDQELSFADWRKAQENY